MKNTQETIALPDFDVTLVHNDSEIDVNLCNLIQNNECGLVLYFYPKDNTQGCSIQAVDFSHLKEQFKTKGYQIIGVSRDSIRSHHNFITKKSLDIALISDTDEKLCQYFDVIKEKMMYGKTHLGVVRSTFIFNKDGQMVASFRNVKAKEHAQNLLNIL